MKSLLALLADDILKARVAPTPAIRVSVLASSMTPPAAPATLKRWITFGGVA